MAYLNKSLSKSVIYLYTYGPIFIKTYVYVRQVMELQLSCSIVDSKTQSHGSLTSVTWSMY